MGVLRLSVARSAYVARLVLLLVIVIGLLVRVWVAPFSSGSDIAQFAGFGDSFLRHGLCFYEYANASRWREEGWPYNWAFPYGPVWLYILGILRSYVRSPVKVVHDETLKVYVPLDWVVAVKAVLIAVDTLDALLIYLIVARRVGGWMGVGAAALYYLNPMTIYISSIFGMFDQLALLFLLGGLASLEWNRLVSGFLVGTALITKHTLLLPVAGVIIYSIVSRKFDVRLAAGLALGILLPFLPIVAACPSSLPSVYGSMMSTMEPSYTLPICYSFNGLSSLASYLHEVSGGDYLWILRNWLLPATLLALPVLAHIYVSRRVFEGAALAYTVFTAAYWRVNHQYLVPLVGLLVLLIFLGKEGFASRLLAFIITVFIGFWVVAFPTSWWFHVHIEKPNWDMIRLIDSLTLMIFDEEFYVGYSLMLTIQQYLLIIASTWRPTVTLVKRLWGRLSGRLRKR